MIKHLLPIAVGVCLLSPAALAGDGRPNIVLILADDLGYSDLGCYGGEIDTPHIDALAADGARLTQLYNSARCCPSRASLMTGLYPTQAGIGDFTTANPSKTRGPGYLGRLNNRCVTLAEVLKPAGYRCYYVGKWHMHDKTGPIKRGFDEFYGYTRGYAHDQYDADYYQRLPRGREKEIDPPASDYYATDAFNEYALEFIRQGQRSERPWFVFLGHSSPHFPVQAPAERADKYDATYRRGWDVLRRERFERMKKIGLADGRHWQLPPRSTVPLDRDDIANGFSGKQNPAWASLDEARRHDLARRMAVFAAMVESIDHGVGRIVEHLRKTGDLDNTLILLLSDNGACYEWGPFGFDGPSRKGTTTLRTGDQLRKTGGPGTYQSYGSAWANLGNTPFRLYKHFTHEGGISTPMIAHWPEGIGKPDRWVRDPAHVMDIMPTLMEAAQATYPQRHQGNNVTPLEGVSLIPAMRGERLPNRPIGFDHMGARALRKGDWKAVWSKRMPRKTQWELYNLAEDRCETNDLASHHPDRVQAMAGQWERWARRVGVIYPPGKPPSASAVHTTPVTMTRMLEPGFWHARLKTNRDVTVWHALAQCESTGRINNFRIAAGDAEGTYRGLRFDDSDFYKVIEGASRILAASPDPKLDAELDRLIDIVARAQRPDGYLYTVMQVPHAKDAPVKGVTPGEPWVHEQESHETYCMGHLIEAGIAHHQATGKRSLLEVAIKAADCLDANFGPGKLELPSGHQQVEIALARLSEVTADKRYLALAEFFLEQRGRLSPDRKRNWGAYFQDHRPIREQKEAVGHSVRAAYLYMAMADVARATHSDEYRNVLHTLWDNVAEKKLYLTGGIGGGAGEGFSAEYQLPNLRAYNETCSSVANILWQQRMFLLNPDSKYIDIAERCLYNSFLSGVSIEGDAFFYPNKLTSVSGHRRSPWFRCACCPPNVVRFLPQAPSLFYATQRNKLFVNMYGSSETTAPLPAGDVRLVQTSRYPWDGKVSIEVHPDAESEFTIAIRHPGWLKQPFPSSLYRYADEAPEGSTTLRIKVNGQTHRGTISNGYEHITRRWSPGDTIAFELPMPVRRVVASERVDSCRGRTALMRGPIVYAAEGHDNEGRVHSLVVPSDARFKPSDRGDLLGGLVTIAGGVHALAHTPHGQITKRSHRLTAIPYYAWAHRGPSPMRVWLAAEPRYAWPAPADLAYSKARITTSGTNRWTSTRAVNDQYLPPSSGDTETPRFLWDKTSSAPVGAGELEGSPTASGFKEGVRWIRYDYANPIKLSNTAIYWAEGDHGRCAIPADYRLLYLEDGAWKSIEAKLPKPQPDRLQSIDFAPVTTRSVRLEVVTQKNKTAGIMEWALR